MMKRISTVTGIFALVAGCSASEDAEDKKDSLDGVGATSCTVAEDADGGAIIECPDGTSATVGRGADGANGEDGAPGSRGKDGDPGEDGRDGSNGNRGEKGERGEPGEDGIDGEPGEKGDPGEDGGSCSVECAGDTTVKIVCENGAEQSYHVESCEAGDGGGVISGRMLAVSDNHGCRVMKDGRLVCWGESSSGGLGNGNLVDDQRTGSFVDARALPLGLETKWRSVTAGPSHTCAVTSSGEGYCWGHDGNGKLGLGARAALGERQLVPKPIDRSALSRDARWSLLSAGSSSTCGVTSDGAGFCWGDDTNGLLGNGAVSGAQSSPSRIDRSALEPGVSWSAISVGVDHACGITSDGAALCWGSDTHGQLGNGPATTEARSSPTRVDLTNLAPETQWATISAGAQYTCGVTTEGHAYCWGSDGGGLLGNGALGNSDSPGLVDSSALPQGVAWKQVSAGVQITCGVTTDGAAYCWGRGVGNGSSVSTTTQVPVAVNVTALPAGTSWAAVDAGRQYACGLAITGATYCWGSNNPAGRLGSGGTGSLTKPEVAVGTSLGLLPSAFALAGALGDPTNPSIGLTLIPSATSAEDIALSVSSSDDSVIPAAGVTIFGTGIERAAFFEPVGVGRATVTFNARDALGNESTVEISYAASGTAPDPTGRYHDGISDASTAIDLGDGYMLLGNDETNVLFLHRQDQSGPPIKVWDLSSVLSGSELDIEAAARVGDEIVWVTSHGNSRAGELKERRRVIFATTITGTGAGVELEFSGRYGGGAASEPKDQVGARGLRADLIAWDRANGHGLGADRLGFIAATADGVVPNAPSGFNIEGFEFAADGKTGYLGFRAPTVEIGGIRHALIVPVTNVLELVDGTNEVQTGRSKFGAPIFLDLAGRSIRELRRNNAFEYLILAGPPDDATPGVNDTFALYVWDGDPAHPPLLNQELPQPDFLTGGVWEGIVSTPNPAASGALVRVVADSGDTVFNGTTTTSKSYSQLFALH